MAVSKFGRKRRERTKQIAVTPIRRKPPAAVAKASHVSSPARDYKREREAKAAELARDVEALHALQARRPLAPPTRERPPVTHATAAELALAKDRRLGLVEWGSG